MLLHMKKCSHHSIVANEKKILPDHHKNQHPYTVGKDDMLMLSQNESVKYFMQKYQKKQTSQTTKDILSEGCKKHPYPQTYHSTNPIQDCSNQYHYIGQHDPTQEQTVETGASSNNIGACINLLEKMPANTTPAVTASLTLTSETAAVASACTSEMGQLQGTGFLTPYNHIFMRVLWLPIL